MKRIVIYGTGSVSEYILQFIDDNMVEVVAFINDSKEFFEFHNKPVISVVELKDYDYDYIIIASGYVETLKNNLLETGVSKSRICAFIFDDISFYQDVHQCINSYINNQYNTHIIKSLVKKEVRLSEFYAAVLWDNTRQITRFHKDFVREQTVKLIADRINELDVPGNVAECGVFRGDFTVLLDEVFTDQSLYLFDTFSGFSEKDLEQDQSISNEKGEGQKFKNTSEQFVLNRLSNKDRVVFKSGYFPDTFDLYDEFFCFVSIDFNIRKPVYDALDLFYPRLSSGGAILVSDYYAPFYGGTREAVDEWCVSNNKNCIPVADFYGSVLITKD